MTYTKSVIEISEPPSNITKQEIKVLWCVVQGMDNKEIAENLCITLSTVKFHLAHIFKKTMTKNRTELTQKVLLMLLKNSLDFETFSQLFENNFSRMAGRHYT